MITFWSGVRKSQLFPNFYQHPSFLNAIRNIKERWFTEKWKLVRFSSVPSYKLKKLLLHPFLLWKYMPKMYLLSYLKYFILITWKITGNDELIFTKNKVTTNKFLLFLIQKVVSISNQLITISRFLLFQKHANQASIINLILRMPTLNEISVSSDSNKRYWPIWLGL